MVPKDRDDNSASLTINDTFLSLAMDSVSDEGKACQSASQPEKCYLISIGNMGIYIYIYMYMYVQIKFNGFRWNDMEIHVVRIPMGSHGPMGPRAQAPGAQWMDGTDRDAGQSGNSFWLGTQMNR